MTIQTGDLIFYRVTPQSGWRARLIAVLQLLRKEGAGPTSYSHVAIAEDNAMLLEAWWPRARRRAIDVGNPAVEVWRVIDASAAAALSAVGSARSRLGEWYGLGELFFGLFSDRHASICTTFVARAWKSVGYDLAINTGSLLAPNELVDSGLIRRSDV